MSPDPPREESQENGDNIVPGTVIPFLNLADDDIMDDGEYELDFSPESDDDDDSDQEPEQEDPISVDENGEPRVRARYRLLIPFPAAENAENQSEVQEVEFRHGNPSEPSRAAEHESTDVEPSEATVETQERTEAKRDIQLTAESADVIKNAMKGISLPPTAIPDWAKEITEDVWKSRLLATMEKKVGNTSDPPAHHSRNSKK